MQFALSGVYRNVNTPKIVLVVSTWNNIEKLKLKVEYLQSEIDSFAKTK